MSAGSTKFPADMRFYIHNNGLSLFSAIEEFSYHSGDFFSIHAGAGE